MFLKVLIAVSVSIILQSINNYACAMGDKQKGLEAQCELAKKYLNGDGVTQDYKKAFTIYLKAANAGSARAQNELGTLYKNGNGVEASCNESVKWYKKSIKQNYAKAKGNLAVMYYDGNCVQQDINKSLQLFKECANAGITQCMDNVGVIYQKNILDYKMAFKWYMKGAEAGDPSCQMIVGSMYNLGEGVPRNDALALYWLKKAAMQNNEEAINILRSWR